MSVKILKPKHLYQCNLYQAKNGIFIKSMHESAEDMQQNMMYIIT